MLTSDQLHNSTVRGTVYRKRDHSWIYAFKLPIRHDDPKTTKHGINQAGRRTYQLGPLSQDTADVGNGARRGCSHAGTVLAQARSDAGVLSMSTCQCICQLRMSSFEKRGLYGFIHIWLGIRCICITYD